MTEEQKKQEALGKLRSALLNHKELETKVKTLRVEKNELQKQ